MMPPMRRNWIVWLAGYLLLVGGLAWVWSANPESSQGHPVDPTARLGIVSAVVLPLGLGLGVALSNVEEDAYGARAAVVALMAVATVAIAAAISTLPDDFQTCLALRRLPELPAECSTTRALRTAVLAEATADWLLFGAAWAAATRWRRSRRLARERARAAA